MEKNKMVIEYIDNIVLEIRKLGINIPYEKIRKVKDRFTDRSEDFEVLKKEIDELYEEFIKGYLEAPSIDSVINSLHIEPEVEPFIGESYKSSLFGVFEIYENVMNDDSITNKKEAFLAERDKFLRKEVRRIDDYIDNQVSDTYRIRLDKLDAFKGYETLTFEVVGNLYNTFINDIDLVVPQNEAKMNYVIDNTKKVFESDGSINPEIYNFSDLKKLFDYATIKGKDIKLHTLVWHKAVPENLQNEIEAMPVDQQRGALLAFFNNYCSEMSKFINENGYNLRQVDVLNEIVSDDDTKDLLRNSFFKRILGNNPENGDNYYIDLLKIARNYFPDVEFLYNDYNEFNPKKCDRICALIKDIEEKSKRDGINYIDGLGLQTHVAPYTSASKGTAREVVPAFIYEVMAKYNNLGIPLYRTEIDSFQFDDSNKYEEIVSTIRECDKHSNINGISLFGNSDALGWSNSAEDGHFIHRNGTPKKSFIFYKELIGTKKKQRESFDDLNYINGLLDKGMSELDSSLSLDKVVEEQAKTFNDAYKKGKKEEKKAIEKGREYFTNAVTMGFDNKDDILGASKHIATINLSRDQDQINKAKEGLNTLKEKNVMTRTSEVKSTEKPKVMRRNTNFNSGYATAFYILLNLGIIGSCITAIFYIINNFS